MSGVSTIITEMTPDERAQSLIDEFLKASSRPGEAEKRKSAIKSAMNIARGCLDTSDHAEGWDEYWQQVVEAISKR
jgi:hypothetical protein